MISILRWLEIKWNCMDYSKVVFTFHIQTTKQLRWLYCLSLGVTLFLMICCIKHWNHTMDLSLPFRLCTFDDITMTSSVFKRNPIFFLSFHVFENMDPPKFCAPFGCWFVVLTAHNWQKWKSIFLTSPCHIIHRVEAVGLKSSSYT